MKISKHIKTSLLLLSVLFTIYSCNSKNEIKESDMKKENSVLAAKISETKLTASYSINQERLAAHYAAYPDRWNLVFDFLAKGVDTLGLGRIDLSDDVYCSVATYNTKTQEELKYESHKKYIDLQYLISGREYMGLIFDRSILKVVDPYNEEKDYELYAPAYGDLHLADSGKFFIFFPEDNHMPCIQVEKPEEVKKLVIKIKID